MLTDILKIVGLVFIGFLVIAFIIHAIWGWAGVIILAIIVLIGTAIGLHKNVTEKRKAQEANARKEKEERRRKWQEEKERQTLEKRIEEQRIAKEAEDRARRERRAAFLAEKESEFLAELDAIPSAEICLSTNMYKRRAVSDMPEVKFANITKKTNPLTFTSYVVVDVETTGIPLTSKIIELSAIRFEGFEPVEKFSTLINPEKEIPAEATRINQITNEMVADAPKIWEAMPAFQTFVGSSPIVGHNLPFDLQFLYAYGFELNNPKQRFYDTLQLSKSVLVKANYYGSNNYDVEDYKLGTLCDYYKIYIAKAHRSCSDCLATGKLFEKLAKQKMG